MDSEQNKKPNNQAPQTNRPKKKFHYYRNRKQSGQVQSDAKPRSSFKKISIVVPLYNEEDSLHPLYNEIKKALKLINIDYELLFIDDGSSDKSLTILKEFTRLDNKVKYFSFRKNYGKAAALQIAFKNCVGDAVITMDADLQDDPSEIQNLIKKLDEGYDLVSGWKRQRFDPFIKKHTSRFFNFVTRLMSGIKIHDFNCGLKAYRKDVVKNIYIYGELHRYIPVLAKWQGFTVTEIPVKHHPRRYGKTKYGLSRFFKGFVDSITVIFITRYVTRPMHIFGFMGTISFLLGILVNLFLSVEWYLGKPLSNRPLLFLGILLIIVGVQFFAVGLLGEVIVHNMQSDKEYLIKDKK